MCVVCVRQGRRRRRRRGRGRGRKWTDSNKADACGEGAGRGKRKGRGVVPLNSDSPVIIKRRVKQVRVVTNFLEFGHDVQ